MQHTKHVIQASINHLAAFMSSAILQGVLQHPPHPYFPQPCSRDNCNKCVGEKKSCAALMSVFLIQQMCTRLENLKAATTTEFIYKALHIQVSASD